ncbi:MAG: hypothetical protein WC966_11720 [Bradymonadales bacterium]|jgi:hypothetical protein
MSDPPIHKATKDAILSEDSRIVIRDGKVIIENLSQDLLDVALALNPNDLDLLERKEALDEDTRGEDVDGTL